jgi:hypothetical protein
MTDDEMTLWGWVVLAASVFMSALVFAAPAEYLSRRRGAGFGIRLLVWAICATLILALYGLWVAAECWYYNGARAWSCFAGLTLSLWCPIGVLLAFWSVAYAAAGAVCILIYRYALGDRRASP